MDLLILRIGSRQATSGGHNSRVSRFRDAVSSRSNTEKLFGIRCQWFHAVTTTRGTVLLQVARTFPTGQLIKLHNVGNSLYTYQLLARLSTEERANTEEKAPTINDNNQRLSGANDLSTLQTKTSQFLNQEVFAVGSMKLHDFEEARETLLAWLDEREPSPVMLVNRPSDLLERLVIEQDSSFLSVQQIGLLLNTQLLNAVVRHWYAHYRNIVGTPQEEAVMGPMGLFNKIEEWCKLCPSLGPQTKAISTIMRALTFQKVSTFEDAQVVEALLQNMVKEFQRGNHKMTPTITEYNLVMNAMAKAREPERAEAILNRICTDYELGISKLKPGAASFGAVLFAWKHVSRNDGGKRAEAVLDRMIAWGKLEQDISLAHPRQESYYSVLCAWCHPKTKNGMEQAERFLRRMQDDYRAGNHEARPTDAVYGLIIYTWSQMGCGAQSEEMLRQMYDDYIQNENHLAEVKSCHFKAAIDGWVRSDTKDAFHRAFTLFQAMQQTNVDPDAAIYGSVLLGLSRSKKRNAGELGEQLLRDQQIRFEAGNETCKPDALHYNAAMHCWASVGNMDRAASLLRKLIQEHKAGTVQIEDDRPYCTLFAACARSRDPKAVVIANSFFQELKTLCKTGIFDWQPSVNCYGVLQGCWASAEQPDSGDQCLALLDEIWERHLAGDESIRPIEANYKTVIDAFARIQSPHRAEEVWYRMLQNFLDGNPDAKPGSDSCKAVLAGWLISGAPNAIQRTLDFIDRITEVDRSDTIELKVDRNAYTLMLDICSKSADPNVTAGAEMIVRKIKEIHDEGRGATGPDTKCYNIAINCLGKIDQAERSEALFWKLYSDYSQTGNGLIKPDNYTIATVLTAWSKSTSESATRRAEVFFERIQKLLDLGKLENVKLDSFCYAALLNALVKAQTEEAAETAESVFTEMQESYRASGDDALRPIKSCFVACLICLSRLGKVERAEEVLMEMHELYLQGRRDLKLDRRTCTLAFTAWLKSDEEDGILRAEKLLWWMESHLDPKERPDAMNYAGLVRCWAKSRRPDAGKRAEAILLQMIKRFGPHRQIVKDCHTDVVCAVARSNNAERSEELLLRLCDNYLDTKTRQGAPLPEQRAFIAVLAALSRAKVASLGLRSLRIVERLRRFDMPSKVLDCWNDSSSEGDPEKRLKAFLAHMEELDTSSGADKGSVAHDDGFVNIALKY